MTIFEELAKEAMSPSDYEEHIPVIDINTASDVFRKIIEKILNEIPDYPEVMSDARNMKERKQLLRDKWL